MVFDDDAREEGHVDACVCVCAVYVKRDQNGAIFIERAVHFPYG